MSDNTAANTEPGLEWIENRLVPAIFYLGAAVAVVMAGMDTGFSLDELASWELVLAVAVAVPAVFLLTVSLFGLVTYFVFLPSITHDAHLFSRAHGTHLIHPLTTSVLLGITAMCLVTGSAAAWAVWAVLVPVYIVQTVLIVKRVREENPVNGNSDAQAGTLVFVLNLILGAEVVTFAGGAKALPPWRIDTLPEDTWIVDIRTKPEFHWNRLQGAENYPWGVGLAEAAQDRLKDRPVLITCLSGHRSPSVAVMMRKLGFKTVYNLNWGLLYLILLQRGQKQEGAFALTRPHRDPNRRGEDIKGITVGYIALQGIILVLAPVEHILGNVQVSATQQVLGALLALGGLSLGVLSFRALGRNFRFFAAPRRSGTLVTSGIYSRIRHPMYTGVITMFAGYVLFWGSLLSVPLWLAFSILYMIKSVKEERILMDRFPDYREYKNRTWRFFPLV